jgi:hypothetical protein
MPKASRIPSPIGAPINKLASISRLPVATRRVRGAGAKPVIEPVREGESHMDTSKPANCPRSICIGETGFLRPETKRPKIAFRPETVSAETETQPQKPANCGLLGRLREIFRFERLRGGPDRIRTAHHTIMALDLIGY